MKSNKFFKPTSNCTKYWTKTTYMSLAYRVFLFFVFMSSFYNCKQDLVLDDAWIFTLEGHTTSSSPIGVDLTGDHIMDIVLGAGGEEWSTCTHGVIAIDGKSGQLLWSVPANNQIVGSAIVKDITQDNIPDVVIGGRSAELFAIDGSNGEIIWRFYNKPGKFSSRLDTLYNFYNGQWVEDQNNDGISDIIICNGGDAIIPAGAKHRPPGTLMLICGKTGVKISEMKMPDAEETYFSPVIFDYNNKKGIIFGSGGESRKGNLYFIYWEDFIAKKFDFTLHIDSSNAKGFVAPPIIVDLDSDGVKDIVINAVDGRTIAYNGLNFQKLWEVICPNAEVYSQAAIGNFLYNDQHLDVFVQYAFGQYPDFTSSIYYLIDGKTGEVVRKYEEERFTYVSPIVVDNNNDGWDEVIWSVTTDTIIHKRVKPRVQIKTFDFYNENLSTTDVCSNCANFASTPYIQNSKLYSEIIICTSPAVTSYFPGTTSFEKPKLELTVQKKILRNKLPLNIKWGNYMGSECKSHY